MYLATLSWNYIGITNPRNQTGAIARRKRAKAEPFAQMPVTGRSNFYMTTAAGRLCSRQTTIVRRPFGLPPGLRSFAASTKLIPEKIASDRQCDSYELLSPKSRASHFFARRRTRTRRCSSMSSIPRRPLFVLTVAVRFGVRGPWLPEVRNIGRRRGGVASVTFGKSNYARCTAKLLSSAGAHAVLRFRSD
jgi:hypothetical protein